MASDDVILQLDVNIQKAIKGVAQLDKALQDRLKKSQALSDKFFRHMRKGWSKVNDELRDVDDKFKDIEKDMAGLAEEAETYEGELQKIANTLDTLRDSTSEADRDEYVRQSRLRDLYEDKVAILRQARGEMETLGRQAKAQAKLDIVGKDLKDDMREAAEAFAAPIKSFFSKDIPGMIENSAKLLAKVGKVGPKFGAKLASYGEAMQARAAAGGGGGGSMASAMGGMVKGIGGLVGKMGPMLEMLGKIGPAIGLIGGALAALVKVMIDAEAQAKEFQKNLLQGASTLEFMSRNANDADMAFMDLKDTVTSVRNAAYDFRNIDWGTTAKDHEALWSVLQQEGVSIARITEEFESAKRAGKEAGDATDFYFKTVTTAVAYSRLFGVSLNEIGQAQAEMMSSLGMSLDSVQDQFSTMARTASESGIAANKFFAIIRGVSADLSLYNLRLDDTVDLLGKLGKVMDPRNAQKFLQTAMSVIKNMGRTERLKVSLLAGTGNVAKAVQNDIKKTREAIANEIGKAAQIDPNTVKAVMEKGGEEGAAALEDMINKAPKEQQGALREALSKLNIKEAMSKKGTYGMAQAAGETGPVAQLGIMQKALSRFGGGRTLMEGVGSIGMESMADNLGVNRDQLDQMIQFESIMENQRKVLVANAKKQGKSDEEIRKIDEMGYDDIWETFDDGTQKSLQEMGKQIDYAKKQADLTSSLMDKLDTLISFIMNEIYNVMQGIWDTIVSTFGSTAQKDQFKVSKEVRTAGTPALTEAYSKSGGDIWAYRAEAMAGPIMKSVDAALRKKPANEEEAKKQQELRRQMLTGPGVTEDTILKAMEAAGIKPENMKTVQLRAAAKANAEATLMDPEATRAQKDNAQKQLDAMKAQSVSMEDLQQSLNPEEMTQVLEKIGWFVDPRHGFTQYMADLAKTTGAAGGPGGAPPPAEKPPSAQQDAAAASAAAGQPGGAAAAEAGVPPPAAPGAPPGAPPGTPAAAPGGVGTAATAEALGLPKDQMEAMLRGDADASNALADTLRQPGHGVAMNNTWAKTYLKKIIEDAVLSAERKALFEYWLYSGMDEKDVLGAVDKAGGIEGFAGNLMSGVSGASTRADVLKQMSVDEASPNAAGGLVSGIAGGMAVVHPSPGEGLASVGPGERIVPAGGGGPNVNITVQGGMYGADFPSHLRAGVINLIHEYERRKRFT